ncbi:unnamed protein product, partial [Notodromas monacha]
MMSERAGILATTTRAVASDSVLIDLTKGSVRGYDSRIQFLQKPSWPKNSTLAQPKCAHQALIKVSLGKRERLIRLQLQFKRSSLWSFHLSDSLRARGSLRYVLGDSEAPYTEVWLYNGLLNVLGDNEYRSATRDVPKKKLDLNPLQIFGEPVAKPRRFRRRRTSGRRRKSSSTPHRPKRKLKLVAGKHFLSWKGEDFQDYLPHPSLFTFRSADNEVPVRITRTEASEDPIFGNLQHEPGTHEDGDEEEVVYIGLNRVVDSSVNRSGSGLCKVMISLSKPRDDCSGQQNDCGPNAICKRATKDKQVCICKPGWQRNGKTCTDYDECQIQNGGCVHHCLNYEGNFTCGCREGFAVPPTVSTLTSARITPSNVTDANTNASTRLAATSVLAPREMDAECEELNCAHTCVTGKNHVNGTQSQHQPFMSALNDDPSASPNHGSIIDQFPHQQSSSTTQRGFTTAVAAATASLSNSSLSVSAKKRCRCLSGFFPNPPDFRTCRRTCAIGNGGCQHYCRDSRRGPVCSCHSNYVLSSVDNATCLDDDERLSPADRLRCVDVDECSVDSGACQFHCHNTVGSYSCSCPKGFQLFGGHRCGDFDECSVNNGGCAQICVNLPGKHECKCRPGFRLHPNERDCVDATICLPLPTPSKANMTCSTSYDGFYEETCHVECVSVTGFLLRSLSNARSTTLTCGARTRYQWTDPEGNDGLPSAAFGCS